MRLLPCHGQPVTTETGRGAAVASPKLRILGGLVLAAARAGGG
jgi:hypothetical protein